MTQRFRRSAQFRIDKRRSLRRCRLGHLVVVCDDDLYSRGHCIPASVGLRDAAVHRYYYLGFRMRFKAPTQRA